MINHSPHSFIAIGELRQVAVQLFLIASLLVCFCEFLVGFICTASHMFFFLNLLIFLDVFVCIFLLKMYCNIFLLLCLTLCQWFLNKVVLAWLNIEFSELGFIWGNEVFGMFSHWLSISSSRGCCWFRNRKKTNLQRKNKIHVARVLVSKGLLRTSINSANRVFIICTSENLFSFQLPTIDLVFKHI